MSRAVAALTAVLVAGGLLLMHGIEPPAATAAGHGTPVASASHAVVDHADSHSHTHSQSHAAAGESHSAAAHTQGHTAAGQGEEACTTCGLLGHGVLLCVAVLGSVLAVRLLQRIVAVLRHRAPAVAGRTSSWSAVVDRVPRPPRPVWVELAVMRC